jgi:hypothetical protein
VLPTVAWGQVDRPRRERLKGLSDLTFAANGDLSFAEGMRSFWASCPRGRRVAEITMPKGVSADCAEGPRAFREKRKPNWKGR